MTNKLHTIANHAEYLFRLARKVRRSGLVGLAKKIDKVASSLKDISKRHEFVSQSHDHY